MVDVVEAVARALCRNDGYDPDHHWEEFVRAARAAIEALREPSEDQIYAIKAELKTQPRGVSGMTIEAQFRAENTREFAAYYAAIDAILKEPGNE